MAEGAEPVFNQPQPLPPESVLRYRQPHPQHQLPAVRYRRDCLIQTNHLYTVCTVHRPYISAPIARRHPPAVNK